MLRESRVPDVSARPAVQVRRQRPRPPLGAPIPEVIGAVLTMTALALLCIVALTAATSSLGLVGPLLFVGGVALALVEAHVIHRRRR